MSTTKSFVYDPDEFPEIHDFLENLPDRRGALSEAIREAIVFYLENRQSGDGQRGNGDPDVEKALSHLQGEVRTIREMLESGAFAVREGHEENAEANLPDDVLTNLNSLGT